MTPLCGVFYYLKPGSDVMFSWQINYGAYTLQASWWIWVTGDVLAYTMTEVRQKS